MSSFDILAPETPIFGNRFLEASAGTGKTFTIEHLVVRLLKEGDLKLDQILVVTFTRAATRELKMRIRSKLKDVDFEDAQIFTIHGFCQKMLTEFAFEAGVDLSYEILSRKEEKEKVRAYLRKKDWDLEEWRSLLKSCRGEVEAVFKKVMESEEWKKERKKDSFLSPDDILVEMERAVQNSVFVGHVREKYRAVIVDEFQDTDPIQWKIFETLFLQAGLKAFYLVGDPKQSIYAFRKADIYTFLKAKDHFEEVFSLETNYRSEPGLLDGLNRLFCKKDWIDLPALQTTLSVPIAKTVKTGFAGEVSFFSAKGHLGRGKKWPSLDMEENYFFPYIVQEIEDPQKTAILVKDRYQAMRVKHFLQRYDIPCSVRRGTLLSDTAAYAALKDLLIAALDPFDIGSVKKAVFGPLISQQWSEEAADHFLELHEILKEKGFAAFFSAFVKAFDIEVDFDLRSISEKLMEEKQTDRLLTYLENLCEEEEEAPRGHHDGVQIMTVHASKGLEFETVFALGVASRTYEENDHPEEHDAEKMRQLYVAMTRAKKKLHVPIAYDLDDKKLKLGQASPIELFLQRTEANVSSVELNTHIFSLKKFHRTTQPLPEIPPPRIATPSWLRSFSALLQKTSSDISPPSDILPPGAETGVIIHTIFEKAFYVPIPQLVVEEVKGTHLQGWEKTIEEIVEKTLDLPLDGFTLRDVSIHKMLPELEFVFAHQENLIKGFIDLCFEHQGKYYFLDWKTNWLENYSPEKLTGAMRHGDYFFQGEIYATALKRYLKDRTFGGAFYIFVRGPAVHHFYPEVLHD